MKSRKNKGSLTVEASLSLVIFIFAFVSVLGLCKFVKAQIVIQHAIDRVAMELSKYTYIVNRLELNKNVAQKDKFISDTDNLINQAVNLTNVVKQEGKTVSSVDLSYDSKDVNSLSDALKVYKKYEDDYHTVKKSYENLSDTTKKFEGTAQSYFKNPKGILNGIMLVAKNEIADYAISKFVMAPICKSMSEKYLEREDLTADEYLKKLGVVDGLNGINFDLSTLFSDGKTINVTAVYNMKIRFPFFGDKPFLYKLNASTVGWRTKSLGGIASLDTSDSSEGTGKKTINIWDYSNFSRAKEFVKLLQKERNLKPARAPQGIDFYDKNENELTFVHTMKTECKTYSQDGKLKLEEIEKVLMDEFKDNVRKANNAQTVTMTDGSVIDIPKDKKIKMILVVQKSANNSASELEKLMEQIKSKLGVNNLEIELYYSDGQVEVGD